MRYYNLLFLGLMRLGQRTEYKEIAEYVASWGLALIVELNLIIMLGIIGVDKEIFKPYILIPVYILLIIANVQYYKRKSKAFQKLQTEYRAKKVNISFTEGLALFFIAESVILPIVYALLKS